VLITEEWGGRGGLLPTDAAGRFKLRKVQKKETSIRGGKDFWELVPIGAFLHRKGRSQTKKDSDDENRKKIKWKRKQCHSKKSKRPAGLPSRTTQGKGPKEKGQREFRGGTAGEARNKEGGGGKGIRGKRRN